MTPTPTESDEQTAYDPLAALTVSELNDGSRQLRASVVAAITGQTEHYEKALAVVLWLHARRDTPGIGLTRYLELTFTELTDELSRLGPAGEPDPTTPTPSP